MSSMLLSPSAAAAAVDARRAAASPPKKANRDLLVWWLGALLFASLAASVLTGVLEWEHYRKILKWRNVPMTLGDRAIVGWLLWAKSVLPLAPVLLTAGLVAASGRRKLATCLLAAGAMLLYFWLAADLVLQSLTGNHVLDYLPYVHDALMSPGRNHVEWAGDTASIAWRSPGCSVNVSGRRLRTRTG